MTASEVADRLREWIESGEYRPGHALPSKTRIAKDVGTSTPTVQMALNVLTAEGLVAGQRGAGTFVRQPAQPVALDELTAGLPAFKRVPDTAPIWVADRFGCDRGTVDTFTSAGTSVLVTRWNAPENGGVGDADGGVSPASTGRELQARAAAPDERVRLGLRAGTPVLAVVQVDYGTDGSVLRITRCTIVGADHIVDLGTVAC